MKNHILLILIFLVVKACSPPSPETAGYDFSELPGGVVNPLSVDTSKVKKPVPFSIENPRRVAVSAPLHIPSRTYAFDISEPLKVEAVIPQGISPGKNGIPLPDIQPAQPRREDAGFPEVVSAKDAYSPLNNPYSFSFFNRIQGLQHDDISAIAQDKAGNLWMGTYGGGAIRYDGVNFYHYSAREGLWENHILTVMTDKSGNVWLGTRSGGAIKYDGMHFYVYDNQGGLADNRVESFFESSDGSIWIGTYAGVSRYDGETITSYTPENGLGEHVIYTILEDAEGNMWFGTREGGISMFDGETFYTYTVTHGLIHNNIVASMLDDKNHLWLASDGGGVCRFDGVAFYHYSEEIGFADNYTNAILQDRQGKIWVGTRTKGLVKLTDSGFILFGEEQGLTNTFITHIFEDVFGKIWFGTYGGGLGQYNGNLFRHYGEKQGLRDSFVRSIYQDQQGDLWLGTNRGGVFRYNGSYFLNFNTDHGLSSNRVSGVLEDSQGKFWIATTGGGVNMYDGNYFWHFDESSCFPDDLILSMFTDSRENLWFTTRYSGLVKYDGKQFTHFTEEHGLHANDTRVVTEDSFGNIWIGTGTAGIARYDGVSFTHFNEEGGLPFNNILDMTFDSQGNLWMATNGHGVVWFNGQEYKVFSTPEGLISEVVYSVLEDKDGYMWFGTRMGLARLLFHAENGTLPSSDRRIRLYIKNYSQDEGFIGIGCNSRTILEDDAGNIWVGANDLLTVYFPEGDSPDTLAPRVQLTSVGLYNESVPWPALLSADDTLFTLANGVKVKNLGFDGVSPWYGLPQNLNLAHNNNFISFSFVGITTHMVKKIRYQYMLEGLDAQWSMPGYRTDVSYGNLSPGKYRFKLRAINSEGYISEELEFSFRVRSPWWFTWWAYALYLLVLVLSGLWFYYRYERIKADKENKKQRELMLEQEVAVARKSAQFKQNFLANMSHEIRTPLTGIMGMASMLKRMELDTTAREYVDALNMAGENLRDTINMILDISKIEAGKLQLKECVFPVKELLIQPVKLFDPLLAPGVEFVTRVDDYVPDFAIADQSRVSQILKNLVSNAVKFTHHGSITLKIELEDKEIRKKIDAKRKIMIKVSVCDTGSGISAEDQNKLFTPFFQTGKMARGNMEGTGLGLAICKELTNLLGGQIGVNSQLGQGSCFWFTFSASAVENPETADRKSVTTSEKNNNLSLSVLLVEDKVITQKVITLMLNAMGHTVVVASNGVEALKLFTPSTYDLILMDIQMPEMDGVTATKHLRAKYHELPPIVGLSANAFEGDREKYISQGLDEYITKPVKENDFNKVLHKLDLLQLGK